MIRTFKERLCLLMLIRYARQEDIPAINKIYNQAVLNTVGTLDTEPKSIENQKVWFFEHSKRYPVFVVVNLHKEVIGWGSLSKWSPKRGYFQTGEVSIYIKENFQGKGLGNKLLKKIIDHGQKSTLHTILARVASENLASLHLHRKHGFQLIGVMKEVGFKFGRHVDIHLLQLLV
ncbi:N-acetyltransferase family protein [Proteinivorax tanatarense]|uniref:N-acetyltransferase family protein n=1 Tax=Proteinivorax tanatarense TaxID=1260629 RepID=A0AAU7VJE7_9FIRM